MMKKSFAKKEVPKEDIPEELIVPLTEEERFRQALLYAEQQNYSDAEKEYGELLKITSSNSIYYFNIANLQDHVGTKEKQLEYLRKCVELEPNHQSAYFQIGKLLEAQSETLEAIKSYEQQIRVNNKHLDSYIKLFKILIIQNKRDEAVKVLQACLEYNASSEKVIILLRDILIEDGKEEQLKLLNNLHSKQIEEIFEKCEHLKSAHASLKKSLKTKALTSFKKAIEQYPQSATLKYELGIIFIKEWHALPAIALFKDSLKLAPQFCHSRFRLAQLYLSTKQPDQAKEQLVALLKYNPTHSMALCELGKLEIKNKNFKEALHYLKQSIRICDSCPSIYGSLGIAYWKIGKIKKAQLHLAVSKEKKETEWDDYLDFISGKCYLILGEMKKALECFNRMSGKTSQREKAKQQCYIGVAHYNLGEPCGNYFDESQISSLKSSIRLISIKQNLQSRIGSQNCKDIQQLTEKLEPYIKEYQDPDFQALLSEAIIISGSHLYLAIEFIEQGLKETKIKEGSSEVSIQGKEVQEEEVIRKHIGCYIQEAKMKILLGKEQEALDQIQWALKKLSTGKETQVKNNQSEIDFKTIEQKKQVKESWFKIDWKWRAEFIQIQAYIKLKMFNEAEAELQVLPARSFQEYKKQLNHYKGQILLSQGKTDEAMTMFKANLSYSESAFELAMIYKQQNNTIQAKSYLNEALNQSPNNLKYLKLMGDIEHSMKNYTASTTQYQKYDQLIKIQNKWLKNMSSTKRQIQIEYDVPYKIGKNLFYSKDFQSALQFFKESLEINDSQPKVLQKVGKISIANKNYKEGEQYLLQSILLEENAETFYQLGLCSLTYLDFQNAQEYFEKADQLDPTHFNAIQNLGECNLKLEEFLNARQYFMRCFEMQPSDEITLLGLSKCIWKIDKDVVKAEQSFLRCMEQHKTSQKTFQQILKFYKEIEKLPLKTFLDKFKSLFQSHAQILFTLGDSFFHAGEQNTVYYSQSEEFLAILLKLPNLNDLSPRYLSLTYLILSQINFLKQKLSVVDQYISKYQPKILPTAEKLSFYDDHQKKEEYDYEILRARKNLIKNVPENAKQIAKCIKIDPSKYLSYTTMAFFLLSKGSSSAWEFHKKAISCVEKLSLKTQYEQIQILDALQAADMKDYEAAKGILNSILTNNSNAQTCYFYLGEILMKENKLDEAIEKYKMCHSKENEPLNLIDSLPLTREQKLNNLTQMATDLFARGSHSEALLILQKCLDQEPTYSKALMLRTRILLQYGDISKALQSVHAALQSDPEAAMTHYIVAIVQLRSGNQLPGINSLKKCSQIDPNFPDIQLKLALLYQKIMRPQIALSHLLQHLAYYPNSKYALLHSSKLLAHSDKFHQSRTHINRLFNILKSNKEEVQDQENIQKMKDKKDSFFLVPLDDSELKVNEDLINLSEAYSVEAYLLNREGNILGSIDCLLKSLYHNPNNEDSMSSLAIAYSKVGNHKSSIDYYQRLLKLRNKREKQDCSIELLQYYLNLGNEYRATNQIQEAINCYNKALSEAEDDSQKILSNLASCFIEKREYEKATKILEKSLSINKYHAESLFLFGTVYQAKNETIYATKFYESAIKQNPEYSPACIALAKLKLKAGNIQDAIKICETCLEQDTKNFEVEIYLGDCLIKDGKYENATLLFQQLLQKLKNEERNSKQQYQEECCNIQISRIYSLQNNLSETIIHLQKCISSEPDNPKYLHELAMVIAKSEGDLYESLSMLEKAVELCPTNSIYLFNLGVVFNKLNKYELEAEALQKCLSLKPNFEDKAFNNIGVAFQNLYQRNKAKIYLEKSIELNPNLIEAHFNFGNVNALMKNTDVAIQSYERCIQMDPKRINALTNLAISSIIIKDYQTAANSFYECMKLDPSLNQKYSPKLLKLVNLGYTPNPSWIEKASQHPQAKWNIEF